MANLQILKDRLMKELASNEGIPFMEGREKADYKLDTEYEINDFGFIKDQSGKYAVFSVKGDDTHFYFGGQVLTEGLQTIEEQCSEDELAELLKEGIKVKFGKATSKSNKRKYTTVNWML